ncbi:MAG: BspA family leucine-rich repeat surface protein [Firmicutes bacterium]|nr:BspA family leucine-rich repeat surface protein [Bacillota bacterium]
MKKSTKVLLCVIGIFLVTSILIGISYALWVFSVSQESTNVVRSDCFEITYTDGNAINITNGIPLTDDDALDLEPYTFTIENVCSQAVDYNVNIETLNTSTIDLNAVDIMIDKNNKVILGSIDDNDSMFIVNNNSNSSKTIFNGMLAPGARKTHKINIWIDEDATIEQSASKIFSSKVVVNATLNTNYTYAYLQTGKKVNSAFKALSGDESPDFGTTNTSIKQVIRSNVIPDESVTKTNLALPESDYPVYAWFDVDTIYIYSENDFIFLNPDCENMFYRFNNMEYVDLSMFLTSKVTTMSYMFGYSGIKQADFSNFDTHNVTNMASMFLFSGFTSLDLSSFDTSKVNSMGRMFYGSKSLLELNVTSFDTTKITSMNWMFDYLLSLKTLDLSSFDTSKVTDMERMFYYDSSLTTIYVSDKWSTNSVTSDSSMFILCNELVGGSGTKFDSNYTGHEYARIDDPTNDKPGYLTLKAS